METPTKHHQGHSKWRPGDRALIEHAEDDDGNKPHLMATLVLRDSAGQWWFKVDGETYPRYEGGPDLGFSIEKWIHEPPVLDRLAAI